VFFKLFLPNWAFPYFCPAGQWIKLYTLALKEIIMTEYIWKHLPYAVYLDTNGLRSAGHSLKKPWVNELLSITNKYGISLCISELVLEEWCEHIIEILKGNRQKLLSSISLLKDYNIQVPTIEPQEINLPEKSELIELVTQKLINAGFKIIKNWDAPLSKLLNEAVEKRPPFEQGGKGLCDAIILESFVEHAKENFTEARVLVISNDAAVKRSEDRFKKHGITVDFLGESDIVIKLKSLLKNEVATYIEEKESRLKDYILAHGSMILDLVKKTPLKITDWMLDGHFTKEEDRIYGSIERILSVRPTKIANVVGGAPTYGEETPQDRYPVQIFVEIELDIVVSQYNFGLFMQTRAIVEPGMIDKNSPVTLEKKTNLQPQEITKTIKRSIAVYATLDGEKEKQDIFDDLRIEKII
jgi:hypothetical protein